MQKSLLPLQLIEFSNLYPDCVCLEIETVATETEEIELYLNINFNEQWESLLGGRVKFGLKGGELKLNLENCSLSKPSTITIDYVDRYSDNLSYYFSNKGKSVLQTNINKLKLGALKINDYPCSVEVTFNLTPVNISITDAEGLWKHDISPNKHGILERTIAFFWLENRLNPYISYLKLSSENIKPNYNISVENTEEKLQEVINKICNATTDNILELAAIASLNPLEDLSGANFLGTNLSGVDLSGANLEYINLRGAVITDADLSEANLSYAKLTGTDLSGAYLENANLSFADCRCASFALVNLIGANLTEANLTETNLTETNLTSANLNQAIFKDNPGISDTLKNSLLARGAQID